MVSTQPNSFQAKIALARNKPVLVLVIKTLIPDHVVAALVLH